jgi:hypothetical protein
LNARIGKSRVEPSIDRQRENKPLILNQFGNFSAGKEVNS